MLDLARDTGGGLYLLVEFGFKVILCLTSCVFLHRSLYYLRDI